MRTVRLIALMLPLVFAPGCFVFDEIDSGMKEMEARAPKDKQKKEGEQQKAGGKEAEKPTYAKATQAWWGAAKSLSTAEGDGDAAGEPIVNCRLSGRSQFMKRSDCVARGGEAK
jgi:hypothetical protein